MSSTRKDPCPICGAHIAGPRRLLLHLAKHRRIQAGAKPAHGIRVWPDHRLARK